MPFAVIATVSFLLVLGVMVLVHEFGHFAVAKLCGVRVEIFSLGFGTRLFGVKWGDTDYRVSALPSGRLRENVRRSPGLGNYRRSAANSVRIRAGSEC